MSSTNKPFFSIIVPAYNVESYLLECIESVLAQSVSDYELILVDDGSTDQTGQICDRYAGDYQKNRDNRDQKKAHSYSIAQNTEKVNKDYAFPDIKVIHQVNMGLSGARNTGVTEAKGEYLLFLDGDDYFEKGALEAIQKGIEPGLDLLRLQAQEVFEGGEVVRYPEKSFESMTGVDAFSRLAQYHYTENAWLYAYRREFFMENHFRYAEGCIAEDFGLTPLVIASAKSVKSISNICYSYRQRQGGIMSTTKSARLARDMMAQLQENLPAIVALPRTAEIAHFVVASTLTVAARLSQNEFLQIYADAKASKMLQYIHPSSLRALPRAFFLRYCPKLFYRLYHH